MSLLVAVIIVRLECGSESTQSVAVSLLVAVIIVRLECGSESILYNRESIRRVLVVSLW